MMIRAACSVCLLLCVWCRTTLGTEQCITSIVGTSQAKNGWAVNYPKQRKILHMAGLFWVFYSDGHDAVYRTSADGADWCAPVLLREGASLGHRFGCWFGAEKVHYAFCSSEDGEDVVYRCGIPNPDGTITWTVSEQIASEVPQGKNVMYPKVIVDDAGVPWIAFMLYDGGLKKPPYDAIVTRASEAGGPWKTAAGFPCVLVNDNTRTYPDPLGVPLTKGKTFWVYNKNVPKEGYYGRCWNGQSWEAEEAIAMSPCSGGLYSLAAEGNEVHLVFGGGTIYYHKRDPEKGWGKDFTLSTSGSGHTSITVTGPQSLIVTWLDICHHTVHYREMTAGQWGTPQLWLDESHERLANPELGINCNALVASTGAVKAGLVYTTGTEAPFQIKFAAIGQAAHTGAADPDSAGGN